MPSDPMLETIIIIPARYGSTRFPGKPLARLWGKPIIQHVYERASQSRLCSRVIIATDDDRIAAAARGFGAEVAMTRTDHPSGTDRVAEVAAGLKADLIVNVQGDEPLVDPVAIDAAVEPLIAAPMISMSTLAAPIEEIADLANPNVVKVVMDQAGFALYFSRLPIPFVRDGREWRKLVARDDFEVIRYRHIGLYVYPREFLLCLTNLPPTPLEQAEKLEQLRALEHGHKIKVVIVEKASPGIDTPEDLELLVAVPPP